MQGSRIIINSFRLVYLIVDSIFLQLQPVQACSGPVMTCFVHRLIKAFHYHWEIWMKETSSSLAVNGADFIYLDNQTEESTYRNIEYKILIYSFMKFHFASTSFLALVILSFLEAYVAPNTFYNDSLNYFDLAR